MKHRIVVKTLLGTGSAIAVAVIGGLLIHSPRVEAQSLRSESRTAGEDESRIQRGFAIAPVKLKLAGKNRALVGLGSYLVNGVAACNDCHNGAPPTNPTAAWLPGGVPYFGQSPTVINPAVYLAGGRDFGPYPAAGPFPHIISRNLTPDKNGLPEGHTFEEFATIIRTGKDMDGVHPTCAGAPNGTCLPAPIDGDLLQIMPWPAYQNLTDRDLLAIYTYLSAIPCIEGDPGVPPPAGGVQPRCQ